jgi:hypothetical protein
VVVRTGALTSAIGCAPTGGIQRFSVALGDAAAVDVECGSDASFAVTAGKSVSASVYAFAPDGAGPTWGTTCTGAAAAGTTATAVCDPLAKTGSLRLPVASALKALGATCKSGIDVTVVGTSGASKTATCSDDAVTVSGLSPAVYTLQVRALPLDLGATVLCKAQVTPGHVTTVSCGGV